MKVAFILSNTKAKKVTNLKTKNNENNGSMLIALVNLE